jgi:hypothetical protein
MFVTCRPRVVNHKSKGQKGWPADHTLSRFRSRHDGYAPKSVYKSIPCSKVSGDREEWSAGHVDGRVDGLPGIHQLQTDSIKLLEAPLDLHIRILEVEFRTHYTILVLLHL